MKFIWPINTICLWESLVSRKNFNIKYKILPKRFKFQLTVCLCIYIYVYIYSLKIIYQIWTFISKNFFFFNFKFKNFPHRLIPPGHPLVMQFSRSHVISKTTRNRCAWIELTNQPSPVIPNSWACRLMIIWQAACGIENLRF